MSSESTTPKEMTTEERIALVKAKYEANPDYKPGPPTVEIKVTERTIVEPKVEGKSVISLIAKADTAREKRETIRMIEKKLQPVNNAKIPPTIDRETIKKLPVIIRSKTESGASRANFLLECIAWEKENPDGDGEYHFWSEKALTVLSGWIGVSEKDKTEMAQLFSLCMTLFPSKLIQAEVKLDIASAFFISNQIEYYPELFNAILICPYTRLPDRAECCKYLYHSDQEKYVVSIEKHLNEIIDADLDDDVRYESIACFVTATGISSRYVNTPIAVGDVNQALLTRLFLRFIGTSDRTELYYIIMSCEFLLEQKERPDVYEQVSQKLLSIASDVKLDNRTKADACDVLLNHPIEPFSTQAQEIIHKIGEEGQNELEKTIYSNQENVHMLNDTFKTFIERNHTKYVGKLGKIMDLCDYIETIAEASGKDEDALFKIRQSLDRIMIEPTLHTARKVSTSDIFRLVKFLIDGHPAKATLEDRLLEELEDMANTCSSGHAKRLINTLVGFTDELEGMVNIKDQFVANIKARLTSTIRHLPDEDQRDKILEAMACKGEERQPFINHIKSVVKSVDQELREEFIVEGWLSEKKYISIFKQTIDKILE